MIDKTATQSGPRKDGTMCDKCGTEVEIRDHDVGLSKMSLLTCPKCSHRIVRRREEPIHLN